MKICSKCGKKIEQGEICTCQKQRHRIYNEQYRDRIKNAFYHSIGWSKLAKAAKQRANGLDEYALEYEQRITKGKIAHHIYEIEECPELSMSLENLIYVSGRTHSLIHAEYNKDEKTKEEMQKKLLSIRKLD